MKSNDKLSVKCARVKVIAPYTVVLLILLLHSCRFTTDMSLVNQSEANQSTAKRPRISSRPTTTPAPKMVNEKSFRVRWFPVDDAISYRVQLESTDGTILHQEDVTPTGCTHRNQEGHTSGVCTLIYQPPDIDGPILLRLSAVSRDGRISAPSARMRLRRR